MSRKSRRELLQNAAAAWTLPVLAQLSCSKSNSAGIKNQQDATLNRAMNLKDEPPRKFLFVFGAMGGASINDSFMAVRASETKNARFLNTFPDQMVFEAEGTKLRAVDMKRDRIGFLPFEFDAKQTRFLSKYANDIMVTTMQSSTVAHDLGQYRAVSGNNAWNGRTLQEAVAAQYGKGLLIPNANMGTVGFAEHGKDESLPDYAKAQMIADPAFFPFTTHGYKGIRGVPSEKLIQLARRFRSDSLEKASEFLKRSGNQKMVKDWLKYRALQEEMERRDLINSLNPFESTKDLPFREFNLDPNKDGEVLREIFPKLGVNRLQTQAMLAYLLVAKGVSCAVTFGLTMDPSVDGTDDRDNPVPLNVPAAFDFSHNSHRDTQALLWHQTLDVIDRLITLLKATEYRNGESFWQHSMVYIATEFGRDKTREPDDVTFSSGHNQNNACVIISPMANGGKVLGGINKDTLLTYGFDPKTGEEAPGTLMNEAHIYSGILQALGVDTAGSNLPFVPAMSRKS